MDREFLTVIYNSNKDFDYFCDYFSFDNGFISKLTWLCFFKHDFNYLVMAQTDELRKMYAKEFIDKYERVLKINYDFGFDDIYKAQGFISKNSKFIELTNYNRIIFITKKEENIHELKGISINGVFDVKILPLETKFEKPFYEKFNYYVLPTITPCKSCWIEKVCL